MAFSVVDTHIQNPARAGKGKKRNMAKSRRKMSAKQIRHFGTKRQRAALKAKRTSRPKHRARTRPNPPRKRRRVVAAAPPKRRRRAAKKSTAKTRRNPTPMIISWAAGNPAKRRKKTVARSRRKKRVAVARNAGRRRSTQKAVHHRRRRPNPGALGSPMNWIQGGAGVVAGVVGARAIPQMILGASNTGPMGYAANAAAAVGLGYLTHMLFPRNQTLVTAVIAGGFAGLLSRIISDKTPFGAQLSLTGLGDYGLGLYQKSNYPYPPRVQNGRGPGSSMFTWGDGSQGMTPASIASGGTDSTGAC